MVSDARRRAEEALVFMDAALRDDMPPLPSQVRWLADAVRALLAAGPAKGVCVPAEAPNPAKGGPPLLIQRVLQLAVAALHTERHHTLAEEVRSVAVTLASEPAPPDGAEVARLTALLRECNAVCLCGCPESEHESYGEDGESCADEGHECIRVAPAVLEIVQRYRVALAGTPAPRPAQDAVREAAEVVRTILTAHDARLSESGVLTYGPPSKGTGFVAAIQWLRRYDAARGGE